MITLSVGRTQGVIYEAMRLEITPNSADPPSTGWNDDAFVTSGIEKAANDAASNQ